MRGAPVDAESLEWLGALGSAGAARRDAVDRLHALLLRAAWFEVDRRRASLTDLGAAEADAIAARAAAAALGSVLGSLDRAGDGRRFTTWASKFALLEAATALRRREWRTRRRAAATACRPPLRTRVRGLLGGAAGRNGGPEPLHAAIRASLTPHQRRVFVALALDGVPIDVLAEDLGSTRAELYETLRASRGALRAHLAARGRPLRLPADRAAVGGATRGAR